MDVPMIEMDPAEARERLKAYRGALHLGADAEYEAAVAGYEALAKGTPVIQFGEAIRAAGRFEDGRPKLAVARADRNQVRFSCDGGRRATFSATRGQWRDWNYRRDHPDGLLLMDVDMEPAGFYVHMGWALVPMVPPHAVEAAGSRAKLKDYLILWEIEEGWADRAIRAEPDIDPYLLKPIHGDLCAVVAEWDLTDLERAVMSGRRDA